jgi:hypothetical protein
MNIYSNNGYKLEKQSIGNDHRCCFCHQQHFYRLLDDYKLAINSIEDKLIRYSKPNKLLFIGEMLPKNNLQQISLNLNEQINIDQLKKTRTFDRFIPKMVII